MNTRFIDWIWHIRGSLPLAPGQSPDEAFARLDPLFRQPGTNRELGDATLTFDKKDQAAQDKMSIFDSGVLQISDGAVGPVLHFHLISRALLYCFLAPLLFLGFAQLAIVVSKFEKPPTEAAAKKPEKKDVALPQNPIDKALGAPAPEKPKKEPKKENKPATAPAYVFAALFAVLYVVGRVLEDRLIKSLFRKTMRDS